MFELLLALLFAAVTPAPGVPVPPDVAITESQARSMDVRAGTVRGRILVDEPSRPARRRVRTYGGGVTIPQAPQALPRIVWIREAMPGVSPPSAATSTMAQRDTTFVPAFVAVPIGGTVTFPNRDDFFHNVFSYSTGARFDLGAYPIGESKDVTFDVAGLVSVFCEVHDRMRSAILVVQNPFFAEVSDDGTFEFRGVPAGRWTVVAWDPDRGESETAIVVRDGEVTDVELEVG